jgi:hypothetical protein
LSDELDIVGAGIEILVGEVKADPRGVGSGRWIAPDPVRARVSEAVAA